MKLLTISVAAVAVVAAAVTWHYRVTDERKFSELNSRCRLLGKEVFVANVKAEEVSLHYVQFPPPEGQAKLPVLDSRYSPYYVVEKLVSPPSAFREVRFSYEVPESVVTDNACAGSFSMVIRKPGEADKQFPCKSRERLVETFRSRYVVEYVYGSVDRFDIRPFEFRIVDQQAKKVLAYQRSYQLMLGNMDTRYSTVLLGWGSAQGAKTCPFLEPDEFIKRVLRPEV
jgi:hypothetical protein